MQYVSKPPLAKEALATKQVTTAPEPKTVAKPIPLDDACLQIFDDAVRRSVDLIKQHYQRRYAGQPEKLQAVIAEREMESAKVRRVEGDKQRLEAHLSALSARATKAERLLDEATAAYDAEVQRRVGLEQTVVSQQAMIDRLNYTIFNTGRPRSRSPPPRYECGGYRGR